MGQSRREFAVRKTGNVDYVRGDRNAVLPAQRLTKCLTANSAALQWVCARPNAHCDQSEPVQSISKSCVTDCLNDSCALDPILASSQVRCSFASTKDGNVFLKSI